jgi:hypothetical protein
MLEPWKRVMSWNWICHDMSLCYKCYASRLTDLNSKYIWPAVYIPWELNWIMESYSYHFLASTCSISSGLRQWSWFRLQFCGKYNRLQYHTYTALVHRSRKRKLLPRGNDLIYLAFIQCSNTTTVAYTLLSSIELGTSKPSGCTYSCYFL